MSRVLVDTSVWVDHLKNGNQSLVDLLSVNGVLMHPLVLGEIACGTPPDRARTLRDLARLPAAQLAAQREVLGLLEGKKLYGRGIGLIDMTLLTSALITPEASLWTLDRRLAGIADELGVLYTPPIH